MTNFLYTLIIYPLVQAIEIAYMLIYKVFNSPSIAIIGVSVAVTILCLPLYVVAEKWQQTERAIAAKLRPKITKIKAAFKGDEQYLILSTYYRQNHYHPFYALRSSFGILIQIPFFIAAYSYLSHLEALKGVSFLFIHDLSAPDKAIHANSFAVNILPIAMTAINIAAGAIYSRGFPVKEKVQLYGMAAVFLALLYNSPAGLVLYWTMNNVLSLVKNIFYKLKNPFRVLYVLLILFITLAIVYLLCFNNGSFKKRLLFAAACSLILFTPLFIRAIRFVLNTVCTSLVSNHALRNMLFFISCAIITILVSICIPSAVIASSPEEFSFIDSYRSPFPFILNAFLQTAGICAFWTTCIYLLFGDKVKTILTLLLSCIALSALVNAFVFQSNSGMLSSTFLFDSPEALKTSTSVSIINIVVILGIVCGILLLLKKNIRILTLCLGIIAASETAFSLYNIARINNGYKAMLDLQDSSQATVHTISPVFSLSKDKPNIIVIMADRAVNSFVRPIFDEHPQLIDQFDGFTWYPNTLSFANHTLIGAPPIWGGYEYTPREINKRDTASRVEKHNEALLVIPRLLTSSGYHVTVTDPSWANYSWISDVSIYNQYNNITAFNTISHYTNLWNMQHNWGSGQATSTKIKRNGTWFSFLKIMPPMFRPFVYDDGLYWSPDDIGESMTTFINSYSVLDYLPDITGYNAEESEALLITNETPHGPRFLQYPEYLPVETVTNKGNGVFSDDGYFHVNSALWLKLGLWFDELKRNGVYDNTRIIIVSDHGAGLRADLPETGYSIPKGTIERHNPVLLVKDFNMHGEFKTDMAFMTNADVPVLVTNGIVANPVNPFTGKPLTVSPKSDGVYITTNDRSMAFQHAKNTFNIENDEWFFVHDNIFDTANWIKAGE
ncbi:membrane protein [Spirochaetia bacterium]|nr:membrane protein [Spirochaetia bacterium]